MGWDPGYLEGKSRLVNYKNLGQMDTKNDTLERKFPLELMAIWGYLISNITRVYQVAGGLHTWNLLNQSTFG